MLSNAAAPASCAIENLVVMAQVAEVHNFVRKAVSWALRGIGKRSAALHSAAVELAKRLEKAPLPKDGGGAARWIGKDALRDLKAAPRTAPR